MARKLAFLLATTAGILGWAAGASALTCTASSTVICNTASSPTTYVQGAVDGSGAQAAYFTTGTGYWGSNIGSTTPYSTTELSASYSSSGGLGTVTLTFDTNLAGDLTSGHVTGSSPNVQAADIFIQSNAVASNVLASSFNYGISLGDTATGDGGLSAGLYSVNCSISGGNGTGCATSNQIWGSGTTKGNSAGSTARYGGEFSTSGVGTSKNSWQCSLLGSNCEGEPTVLNSGTKLSGSNITENAVFTGGSTDTLTVTLTADNVTGQNLLSAIFGNGFDIFWGTGDNGNAPIYGEIAGLSIPDPPVPEPSSLALLATFAIGFEVVRRRKRKGLTIA